METFFFQSKVPLPIWSSTKCFLSRVAVVMVFLHIKRTLRQAFSAFNVIIVLQSVYGGLYLLCMLNHVWNEVYLTMMDSLCDMCLNSKQNKIVVLNLSQWIGEDRCHLASRITLVTVAEPCAEVLPPLICRWWDERVWVGVRTKLIHAWNKAQFQKSSRRQGVGQTALGGKWSPASSRI